MSSSGSCGRLREMLGGDQDPDPISEGMGANTDADSTSVSTNNKSMFGKLTGPVKNMVRNFKLSHAWKHLPDALQEKIGSPENLTTMFPFTYTVRNDDSDNAEQAQMRISLECAFNYITFVIDPLDDDGNVVQGGNIHIVFKDKKWYSHATFDERGRDYILTTESPLPLFGKMSDADIAEKTDGTVKWIVKLFDLKTEAED